MHEVMDVCWHLGLNWHRVNDSKISRRRRSDTDTLVEYLSLQSLVQFIEFVSSALAERELIDLNRPFEFGTDIKEHQVS